MGDNCLSVGEGGNEREPLRGTSSGDGTDVVTDGGSTVLTNLFDALADERRRYVLYCARQCDGPVKRDELARQVTAWERGKRVDDVTADEIERITTTLLHCDLPKLADAGIIEYDPNDQTVQLSAQNDLAAPFLERAIEVDQPTRSSNSLSDVS